MASYTAVSDIGGTNLRVALMNKAGCIVERERVDTPKNATPEQIVRLVLDLTQLMLNRHPTKADVSTLVLGVPGIVDHDRGLVVKNANLGWHHVPLVSIFQQIVDYPVIIENDVRLHTIGYMASPGVVMPGDWMYVAIGTGVAAGIVTNGRLIGGAHNMAGELGHLTVEPRGSFCGCGKRGCLETVCGVKGLRILWREYIGNQSFDFQTLASPQSQHGDLFEAVTKIWTRFAEALGWALSVASALIDPAVIVLGGGLASTYTIWESRLNATMEQFLMPGIPRPTIQISGLGDDAPLLGAWALAHAMYEGKPYPEMQ